MKEMNGGQLLRRWLKALNVRNVSGRGHLLAGWSHVGRRVVGSGRSGFKLSEDDS